MRPRQGEARNLKQGGEALEPQAWYARHGHSPSIQFFSHATTGIAAGSSPPVNPLGPWNWSCARIFRILPPLLLCVDHRVISFPHVSYF